MHKKGRCKPDVSFIKAP